MSKLERLIQQYCPDGVEYVRLGDIMSIQRGASPRPIQNYLTDDEYGIPWIKIGDVYIESKYITSTKERVTKEGAAKSRLLKRGSFILSNSMSFGRPYILEIDGCIHDGWISMCDFEKHLLPDFLYYLLRSSVVQDFWISKANSGGAVTNLNSDIVRSTLIPVPPLPVQEEIVRVLDTFTELQAELQKRKQQYNYYRDNLLTNFTEEQNVKEYSLGELGTFTRGNGLQKKDFTKEGVGCIHYGQIYTRFGAFADKTLTYVNKELASRLLQVEKGNLVIACTSENVEDICKSVAWLGEENICTGGHACVFKHNQNPKYISYFFQTEYFFNQKKKYTYGTKVKDIKPDSIAKIKISLPSLKEQERIVSILDNLYALTNDLTSGLPAEMEKRRQQYEYYRDRLLTFKRL